MSDPLLPGTIDNNSNKDGSSRANITGSVDQHTTMVQSVKNSSQASSASDYLLSSTSSTTLENNDISPSVLQAFRQLGQLPGNSGQD